MRAACNLRPILDEPGAQEKLTRELFHRQVSIVLGRYNIHVVHLDVQSTLGRSAE